MERYQLAWVGVCWKGLMSYLFRMYFFLIISIPQTFITDRNYARGVYLREYDECSRIHHLNVLVESTFMLDWDPTTGDHNEKKFAFESRISLVATATWVRTPDFLFLHNGGAHVMVTSLLFSNRN